MSKADAGCASKHLSRGGSKGANHYEIASLGARDAEPLDAKATRMLRGANGCLQWLVTNTRLDLAAATSMSHGISPETIKSAIKEINMLV